MGKSVAAKFKVIDYLSQGKFVSGLANCHVEGVYSIVFEPRKDNRRGMLRLFYVETDILSRLEDDKDFIVMPHNHRQDLMLHRLCGNPYQVWMDLQGGNDVVHSYEFTSALIAGEFNLTWRSKLLNATFVPEPISKNGTFMAWDQFHTVVAPAGSAWVVEEMDLAPKWAIPFCFSRSGNKKLQKAGLYTEMSPARTREVVDKIYNLYEREK
jgi:hypothetical protein